MDRRGFCIGLAGWGVGGGLPGAAATKSTSVVAAGSATQALTKDARVLFISGQVPTDDAGNAPATFDAQCRLVWRRLRECLHAAQMDYDHLVKLTVFLGDRGDREAELRWRRKALGRRVGPAATVIVTGIYDEAWKLEIEAIAIAPAQPTSLQSTG